VRWGRSARPLLAASLLLLLLTGCWDIVPIEEVGFVGLVALDRDQKGYHVLFELPTPIGNASGSQAGGSGGSSGVGGGPASQSSGGIAVRGDGATFEAALTHAQARAPVRIWFGVTQVVMATERAARSGALASTLDFFDRSREARSIVWVFLIPDRTFAQVTETLPQGNLPGLPLATEALLGRIRSPIKPVRMYEFLRDAADPGRSAFLPVVDVAAGNFRFVGQAALPGGRLVGVLPTAANRGLAWLLPIPTQELEVEVPKAPGLAVSFRRPTHSFHPFYDRQGHLKGFRVDLHADMDVLQEGRGGVPDLRSPKAMTRLATTAAAHVLADAKASLVAAQALHADIYGFGDVLRSEHPLLFARLARHWQDKVFPRLAFVVTVRIVPAAPGLLSRPSVIQPHGGVG
jgi:spore germination protein KC